MYYKGRGIFHIGVEHDGGGENWGAFCSTV